MKIHPGGGPIKRWRTVTSGWRGSEAGRNFEPVLRELASPPRRILIVRLGAIGDVVRVLPMLHGIRTRFPEAEVDWVVQAKAADILRDHPDVARLWIVPFTRWRDALTPTAWRLRRAMRARNYDLVLDFQGMIKGAIWALAAGGPAVRVGWGPGHAQNLSWLWYHGLRTPPGRRINRHLRHRSLVEWLGVPDVAAPPPSFAPGETLAADRFVEELEARNAPRPWLLAWPGSSGKGSHKRWNPSRQRAALESLARRTGGTVLVGWGPAEAKEAHELAASLAGAVLVPATSIRELACLLSRCDLYLGMDSGPMHLAGLVGIRAVGVFGRSDPEIHGPAPHLPGRAVAGPEAREWGTRERRGLPPFEEPDPERVVDAALELLEVGVAIDRAKEA